MSIIRFTDKYPKRIILVGDENQLPPIGFGKPFHDVIQHIQSSDNLMKEHYINLKSNCRQENDENILKAMILNAEGSLYHSFNVSIKSQDKTSDYMV